MTGPPISGSVAASPQMLPALSIQTSQLPQKLTVELLSPPVTERCYTHNTDNKPYLVLTACHSADTRELPCFFDIMVDMLKTYEHLRGNNQTLSLINYFLLFSLLSSKVV